MSEVSRVICAARSEDDAFFGAIGRFTVSWAWLELGLDLSVHVIHRHLQGNRIDREPPWSLDRKLRYLRRAVSKIPQLAEYRGRLAALIEDVAHIAEARNDLIHGSIVDQSDGRCTIMARLERGTKPATKPATKYFTTDAITITQAAIIANKLAGQSLSLGDELRVRFLPM